MSHPDNEPKYTEWQEETKRRFPALPPEELAKQPSLRSIEAEVRYLVICPDGKIRVPFFLTREEAVAVCHRVNYYNPDIVGLGQRCCTSSAPIGCPNGLHKVESLTLADLKEKDLLFVWVPKGMRVA